MSKRALIIAPFMNRSQHVGVLRVRRFIRWLCQTGYEVVLVSAGSRSREQQHPWGREFVICDPLGLHREQDGQLSSWQRKEYSPAIEVASRILFNPDPAIAWGRMVLRSPEVLSAAQQADLILSSSPPESSHVTAMKIARNTQTKFVVDMRDGWLDEPLKPILTWSSFQRRREARLEEQVLAAAHQIFVTSHVWRELLLERKPELGAKVKVLTNCYPLDFRETAPNHVGDKELILMYMGQFRGSKYNNEPGMLLKPLLAAAQTQRVRLKILLYGKFMRRDLDDIRVAKEVLRAVGSKLELHPPLGYDTMLNSLRQAHGLLLLSATVASLPAKLFEYIPSSRPILAVTPRHSAVWQLAGRVPQMYALPLEDGLQDLSTVEEFLAVCRSGRVLAEVPEEFTENTCLRKFQHCL